MTPEQKAAFVYAQSICALVQMEAMKVANFECQVLGDPIAYLADDFRGIPNRYGITSKEITDLFQEIPGQNDPNQL